MRTSLNWEGRAGPCGADCTSPRRARHGRASDGGIRLILDQRGLPSWTRRANSCSTVARITCGPSAANSKAGWPRSAAQHVARADEDAEDGAGPRGLHAAFLQGKPGLIAPGLGASRSYSARRISESTSWAFSSARRWASARSRASSSRTFSSLTDLSER